jgi:menaquinone-dependent protoporphyrinogen IX oxidase
MGRLLAILLFVPVITLAQEVAGIAKTDSVLLVYSVGEPVEGFGVERVSGESLDAVSCPTPVEKNTGVVARRIYQELSDKGIAVRLARPEEFARADWRQLLRYKTIILGTPTRHSNMSWEMKRFVDQVVHQIYMQVPERAKGTQFALFATAASRGGPDAAMATMESFISHCKSTVVRKLSLHSGQTQQEFDEAIEQFCGVISILAR